MEADTYCVMLLQDKVSTGFT